MTEQLTRARIEEALARANTATEGPWIRHTPFSFADSWVEWATVMGVRSQVVSDERDAEFIAAARSDARAMAEALLRVLDLHEPEAVEVIAQFAPEGYEEWPTVLVSVCSHCLPGYVRDLMAEEEANESDVRSFLYPCATVRAVTGPESGGDGNASY